MRSAGGHRLYSNDDLRDVRALQSLIENGIPPSIAAQQIREKTTSKVVSLPVQENEGIISGAYTTICNRIIEAIEAFDPEQIDAEIRRALLLGTSVDVYEQVIVPVMRIVGERWTHNDPLSTAQEHLVTEIMRGALQDLHRLSRPLRPKATGLIACLEGEQHVLPLYAIAFLLARHSIRTVILGASTPPAAIEVAAAKIKPDFVALSMTVARDALSAEAMFDSYGRCCGSTPWFVGGATIASVTSAVERSGGTAVKHIDDFGTLLMEQIPGLIWA